MEKKPRGFAHPKSFFELVIAGFSLVALPLIIALITGAFFVNKLTGQSEQAVYRAVKSTQESRHLLEHIGAMERSVRQYMVLKDDDVFQRYLSRHENYRRISLNLHTILLDDTLKARLEMLDQLENSLYERFTASHEKKIGGISAQEYIALSELGQTLLQDTSQLIDSEMALMQDMSSQARNIIFWEILAVIPGTVIFIVVFVVLLSRPIRQIDQAIKRIGAGEFEQEIEVSGPRDLEYLGERLNWLRMRLKYLEEKKSKFLHYVSHELKTPLTAVREGAELLSEGVTGPLNDGQKEVTDILKKNSISLQKMIEKLLSFNMPGDATSSILQLVSMLPVVETVLADHKPVIMAKKIDFDLHLDEAYVQGDEEQLRVIIDNLISNAVKYTPENGKVNLSMCVNGDKLLIDVSDTGPGICANEKHAIFEAFYRGEEVEKGMIKGSGLGLSIVSEFVQAHGGTIEVIDRPQGRGAHFRVSLPVANEKDIAWAV